MTKLLFTASLLLTFVCSNAQEIYRMKPLGNWNNPNLATNPQMEGQIWNELTGWVDTSNGREYIIMGSIDSIYFFDVTDPTQIKLCDVEWGLNTVINRDMETYKNYVYCVSDNGPPGKLQIFDLSFLPDSVHKVYESDTLGSNTHSIFINPESKRLYMCINTKNKVILGMDILSIDTPDKPSFLGRLQTSASACARVHEVFVKNDTAYCSCEFKGLFVYDLTDVNNQKFLGGIVPPYPYNGYNHTNWIDSSGQYIAFTDEVPTGQPIKIYKIRELGDMTYLTHFNTHTGATPHNVFWVGTKLYVSWYQDGMYVFDMTNPRIPKIHAYYDTYPQNAKGVYNGYKGCWGVYPFLPSGNIAASDMSNGLFMMKYDSTIALGINSTPINTLNVNVSPNPFSEQVTVQVVAQETALYRIQLYDVQGRLCYSTETVLESGSNEFPLEHVSSLHSGVYMLYIQSGNSESRYKLLKK